MTVQELINTLQTIEPEWTIRNYIEIILHPLTQEVTLRPTKPFHLDIRGGV